MKRGPRGLVSAKFATKRAANQGEIDCLNHDCTMVACAQRLPTARCDCLPHALPPTSPVALDMHTAKIYHLLFFSFFGVPTRSITALCQLTRGAQKHDTSIQRKPECVCAARIHGHGGGATLRQGFKLIRLATTTTTYLTSG